MFNPLDSVKDIVELAKLEAYLSLLQNQPDILKMFRVLLENGCPPKAINAYIEYKIAEGRRGQGET